MKVRPGADGVHPFYDVLEHLQIFLSQQANEKQKKPAEDEDGQVNFWSMDAFLPLQLVFLAWVTFCAGLDTLLMIVPLWVLVAAAAAFVVAAIGFVEKQRKMNAV